MVNSKPPEDRWMERLAARSELAPQRAPSRLKSRIYSAVVRRQQESGPLLSLTETQAAHRGLCVHERLLQIAPVGQRAKRFNCCSVCHARFLAENLEDAPIYWGNCPYVRFQNR